MTVLENLGKVLKERRLRNKKLGLIWSTKDVSEALGISRQLLIHYENENRKIQFDLWWRWCNVLGISHRSVVERLEKELKGVKKDNAENKVE